MSSIHGSNAPSVRRRTGSINSAASSSSTIRRKQAEIKTAKELSLIEKRKEDIQRKINQKEFEVRGIKNEIQAKNDELAYIDNTDEELKKITVNNIRTLETKLKLLQEALIFEKQNAEFDLKDLCRNQSILEKEGALETLIIEVEDDQNLGSDDEYHDTKSVEDIQDSLQDRLAEQKKAAEGPLGHDELKARRLEEEKVKLEFEAAQKRIKKPVPMSVKADNTVLPFESFSPYSTSAHPFYPSDMQYTQPYQPVPFTFSQPYRRDLPIFDGNPQDWPVFYSAFKTSTEKYNISDSDNMDRLQRCLRDKAKERVKTLFTVAANVSRIIQILEQRYGKSESIMDILIQEVKNLSAFKADEYDKILEFVDTIRNLVETAKTMGCTTYIAGSDLIKECLKKIPAFYMYKWGEYKLSNNVQHPTILDVSAWLDKESTAIDSFHTPTYVASKTKKENTSKKPLPKSTENEEDLPTAAGLFVGDNQEKQRSEKGNKSKSTPFQCVFCDKKHLSQECGRAYEQTLEEKKSKILEKNVCFICFKPGHSAKKCKVFVKCILCHGKHHAIVCPKFMEIVKTPLQNNKLMPSKENAVAMNLNCSSEVLLQTLHVRIPFGRRKSIIARILKDSGAQRSYITKSAVGRLRKNPIGEEFLRQALFGGKATTMKKHNKYRIQLQSLFSDFKFEVELLDEDKLCGNIPRVQSGSWMEELKYENIVLADIASESPDIDILIGSDYWGKLMTGNVKQLKCGLTAVETLFGWTLIGKQPISNDSAAMEVLSMHVSEASVTQLWDLEIIGIKDSADIKTKEERDAAVKEHFKENVTRQIDGRYQVSLPWIDEQKNIPTNKLVSKKRLETATAKLKEGQFDIVDSIFDLWIQEGFIEEVPEEDLDKSAHYLPHRPVFKPNSLTTPVRPVFDASCKSGRNPSLNECLEKGPNLMELIPDILIRFRENKIGVISDIRKAFQMIDVVETDRDFLRFLWWKDSSMTSVKELRHRRVVFGVNCSPYLLAAVLQHHLESVTDERKDIATQFMNSLYVDNSVISVNSYDEYKKFKEVTVGLLSEAKMDLTQWECTAEEKPEVDLTSSEECGLETNSSSTTSVLGIKWNKVEDTLACQVPDNVPEKLTKRNVLSVISQIYDPTGFLTPALLQPKITLQKAWRTKSKWDDDFEPQLEHEFMKWWKEAKLLEKVILPRYARYGQYPGREIQLHCFGDASKDAYAAVIFARVEEESGVFVHLVQSKTRVSPLKTITIPRLELLSSLITARLATSVKRAMTVKDMKTYFWSDSTTALAWIKRNDEWGTFVGNRVKEICNLTNPENWRHVPGILNPADLPSRGCSPSELVNSKWWEGPGWLYKSEAFWPNGSESINEEEVQKELKKSGIVTVAVNINSPAPWYCSRYSSYTRNIRLVAWWRRLILILRRRNTITGPLVAEELMTAEKIIIRLVQDECFKGQDGTIEGIQVQREEGFLYVKTKLLNHTGSELFKKPLLLPSDHPLVEQIIRKEHINNQHAGVQILMSRLRERFWILHGRRAIKKVVKSCVTCRRFSEKSKAVPEAPLPLDRVQNTKAFAVTGVDLAGPLHLKDGGKAWIVLFTCAVYRAVHLELVTSLSTEVFVMALQRFIARRGRPVTIYSDNGTNFVGMNNLFKSLDWTSIQEQAGVQRIVWKFNPPSAPWWGGWWERLIRSLKDLLKRQLGHKKLQYVEMETALCNAEAIMNSRPLTYVTEDQEDLIPLTPSMFLQDQVGSEFPELEHIRCQDLNEAYTKMRTLKQNLRSRFEKEYLAQLVHHGKCKKMHNIKVGDIVLIGSDDKKRLMWPLGRVEALIPGNDGEIRLAKLKTEKGIFTRPIQRLYTLEISSQEIPKPTEDVIKKAVKVTKEGKAVEEPVMKTRCGRATQKPDRLKY